MGGLGHRHKSARIRHNDQPDRFALQIRALIIGGEFQEVECVLEDAGNRAVIGGRRPKHELGAPAPVQQFGNTGLRSGRIVVQRPVRVIDRQLQRRRIEQMGHGAGRGGKIQGSCQRRSGARRCPQAAAQSDKHGSRRAGLFIGFHLGNSPGFAAGRGPGGCVTNKTIQGQALVTAIFTKNAVYRRESE